jgi:hypothetical protein
MEHDTWPIQLDKVTGVAHIAHNSPLRKVDDLLSERSSFTGQRRNLRRGRSVGFISGSVKRSREQYQRRTAKVAAARVQFKNIGTVLITCLRLKI